MKDLFGMDEKEQELAKKALSASAAGFIGMGSMFLGFATIVSSPAAGMGLLTYGASKFGSYAHTNRNLKTPSHRSKYYNKNYMEKYLEKIKNIFEDMLKEVE